MATATKRPIPPSWDFERDAEVFEEFIIKNYVTLTEKLQVKAAIPYLIQEGILRRDDREVILACITKQDRAEALLDKVVTRGTCTPSLFVDVLRRSGHLAEMWEETPRSTVTWEEAPRSIVSCLEEAPSSSLAYSEFNPEYQAELHRLLRNSFAEMLKRDMVKNNLVGLLGWEMSNPTIRVSAVNSVSIEQVCRSKSFGTRPTPSLVVKEEAGRQVGTALVADWVGDKKVTSNYEQLYKLQLNKVRKNQTIIDAIFDQLLHDSNYEPSFSKEALWNYMKQTQEKILFVLEGLDRLSPFTSPEILQLIDNKLLPRATIIATVTDANGG